ncbi:MAG: YraN family protein [Sulfurimonas sp.]|jgi:putative endonuclease|nr:YraN family protein [Sulfurimonadaceae bacterium]
MSRAKGNKAEQQAVLFLQDSGFSIIEQNFYSRFGEIDIIAYKDEVLHFVEVKSGDDFEVAVQNITKTKLSRLIKTIDVYLKKHNIKDSSYTLDAIIITPDSIDLLESITL